MSYYESCAVCGCPVSPRDLTVEHQVIAWVRRRNGGGVNQAREQRATGVYRCGPCSNVTRATNRHQSPRLFDEVDR
jgi:hypothetical protein